MYTSVSKIGQGIRIVDVKIIKDDWQALLRMLPSNWRQLAKETGAINRQLRNFDDEEGILRLLFLHLANGYSLRETVTRAKAAGLTNISDVALLKRLRCSEKWLKELSIALLRERGAQLSTDQYSTKINLKLVDGTLVKEPGKTGSQWRIHYSLRLPHLECDYFKLTSSEGNNTGESFKQFPVRKNDCIVGDRGYSTFQGIIYLHQKEAYSLVRVNSSTLTFYTKGDKVFYLLEHISVLEKAYQAGEWEIYLKNTENQIVEGRLCVIRKNDIAAEIAIKKIIKEANKRQRTIRKETLEYAKYIIIFTTLPSEYPLEVILEWYRLRWQVELAFKRLKSLIHLGHLPKHDETSSRAWLYGKLLIGLLTEKLMSYASSFSPSGYWL